MTSAAPPKARRSRKSAQDRKAEILQTAARLAFKVGPDMVTTSMIAAEMGLTQPSIYKHFPSKDDIWVQVSEGIAEQIRANLEHCREADCGPVEKLRMLVGDHLRLLQQTPAMPEIMVLRDLHNSRNTLRHGIAQIMSGFHAMLVENVIAAQKQGLFRRSIEPGDAATLLLGIVQSLVFRMILTRNPAILSQEGERLLDLQLAGFARIPPADPRTEDGE